MNQIFDRPGPLKVHELLRRRADDLESIADRMPVRSYPAGKLLKIADDLRTLAEFMARIAPRGCPWPENAGPSETLQRVELLALSQQAANDGEER